MGSNDVNGRVSIIIPYNNHSDVLGRCINSIREQRYTDIEMVFVNDGSTDNTSNVIHSTMGRQRYREYWVNGPCKYNELGMSYPVFRGVANSTGEFVFVCYPDGVMSENFISELVARIGDRPAILPARRIISGGKAQIITHSVNMNIYKAIIFKSEDIEWIRGNYLFRKYEYFKNFGYIIGSLPMEYIMQTSMWSAGNIEYLNDIMYTEIEPTYYDGIPGYMNKYYMLRYYLDIIYNRILASFRRESDISQNPLYTMCNGNSTLVVDGIYNFINLECDEYKWELKRRAPGPRRKGEEWVVD